MPDVKKIAEEIVAREGGYVNDPDDPGGATNFGVTIGTMKHLGLDLDGDGARDHGGCTAFEPRTSDGHFYHPLFQAAGHRKTTQSFTCYGL